MLKQNGFSIIEVLISLFIVGVIFLVYNASVNTVYLNSNAKNQELALRIASNEMETLRGMPFGSLPSSGPFTSLLLNGLNTPTANIDVSDFNSRTKLITATVTWQDRYTNTARKLTLTTLITNGGL